MSGVRLNIVSSFFTLNNKTMFFYLLFFYLLSESMATGKTTSYDVSNKIICLYQGIINNDSDPSSFTMDVKYIPRECDLILYFTMGINQLSVIDVDEKLLKSVTDLKKPVIVALIRKEKYSGWSAILGENGNANETKILCDFATNHNIKGYLLCFLDPSDSEPVNRNVSKNIIPYIKQLKKLCPFLIISVAIKPIPKRLTNKDIFNFEELNNVITYYHVNVVDLNHCNPMLYNGLTPITKSNTSHNHLYGMEEVVSNLKETEICFNKISINIPLFITSINYTDFTYPEICKGEFDNSSMCVQTSQNYYDKGKFLSKQKFGITVEGVEWDDYNNSCNCKSAFNGFHNIYAGYRNSMVIPCSKYDVQSTVYPIK